MSSDDPTTLGAAPDAATRPSGVETPSGSTGWLSESGAIDHGRFPPGTVLGGRYRIVGRLGRGGMGEVYRADDLKLGQPVALKFLPADVDRDSARLTQLHTEVRMARQVAHPNVCRVYDIDEVEGHTFLSMEYVDGEDLASLLRRVGRFPEERGLEIARQICAGLAAAHERGVVHRDFKPANVMVDGAGKVRITDFGLAGVAGEALRAGTPAYMAPEQLAGGEVTPRSDIYALGLVLYEVFTGRRALEAGNLAELIRRREQGEIVPPSMLTTGLSPKIDRAVMRCLVPDPTARPQSALAVAAALPGGDPLAAALAAGETPSPAMVAAAGEEGTLGRAAGIALVSLALVGAVLVAVQADRLLLVNRVTFPKTADVLEERAREIIAVAGYREPPADTARGVGVNLEYLQWIERTDAAPTKWDFLGDGKAPLLDFWYRTSPRPLQPWAPFWRPERNDPPLDVPGMTRVMVDDRGRLLNFTAVPPHSDPTDRPGEAVDWTPMFQAAALSLADFTETSPGRTPPVYADQRAAWEGPLPQRPDVKLRIEAAAYRGRAVAFTVMGPWTIAPGEDIRQTTAGQRAISAFGTIVVLALLAGAMMLVRANLKSGRSDRRGASRIALFLLAVSVAAWALGARHSSEIEAETSRFFFALGLSLLNVVFTWLFYLALEPFVRRLSPDMLIGWARLLGGQVRDARVGRDVIVGVAAGVFFVILSSFDGFLLALTGAPPQQPQISNMAYFVGARYAIGGILRVLPNALQSAMLGTFMYVVLLAIVRRRWIAATLVMVFICGVILAEADFHHPWIVLSIAAVLSAVTIFIFLRFGLLTLATALYVMQILKTVPLTLDLSRPHAGVSSLALLIVAGVAAYAFHVTRAGEGLLRRLLPQA